MGAELSIEDHQGRQVFGDAVTGGSRFPLVHEGKDLGWVSGPERAGAVATLLQFLVDREAERKSMGAEVLSLYREVNLIYSFSEKLAALLDLERVAQLTLQEARHLIVATDGAILLLDEASGSLNAAAAFGDELPGLSGFTRGHGIAGTVAATGVGEIVNDVMGDPRRVNTVVDVRSLVCAPLKVGEKVIGVIVLASTLPMAYEARELKLLNTLALQTATAIENARLFERTVQAGHERERLLALNKAAEVARAGYERELELAATIQANLFPAELPRMPGYDLAARNLPARRCGGDYYDAIAVDGSGRGLDRAALRRRRVGQGAAGLAPHEPHAGDPAGAARSHGIAEGTRRPRPRAAARLDRGQQIRHRGPARAVAGDRPGHVRQRRPHQQPPDHR